MTAKVSKEIRISLQAMTISKTAKFKRFCKASRKIKRKIFTRGCDEHDEGC